MGKSLIKDSENIAGIPFDRKYRTSWFVKLASSGTTQNVSGF
jgi:hypothetical protein